ncbi:MAG: carbon storage regulator CsrA [Armatimonadota bacterium]
MLILARKVGQKIIIAGDIEITVVEVRGEHVRLGINAPRSVAVHRKELLEHMAVEAMHPIPS